MPVARADDDIVNELLADPALDQPSAQAIAATDPLDVDPDVYADCPGYDATYPYFVKDQLFKTYGPAEDKPLRADVYVPTLDDFPNPTERFPAMILVHGGGWWRGCKTNLQKEASIAAGTNLDAETLPQHFVTFTINYRLDCDPADPNLPAGILDRCGWTFQTDDPGEGHDGITDTGAAIHDIQDAIDWVKANANVYCRQARQGNDCWNGNIELVGSSAGGNLALMASGRLGPTSEL